MRLVPLTLLVALALPVAAQTTHTVVVRNFEFDPATLTIEAGDTVVWMNESGFHNVRQLTGSETFGNAAANAPWEYSFTFNEVGTSTYDCQVHPASMQGSVTVTQNTSSEGVDEVRGRLVHAGPNPFRDAATLTLELPETQSVRVAVYDVLGREVAVLHEGAAPTGETALTWTPGDEEAGVFVVRATGSGLDLSLGIARVGTHGGRH